MLIYDEQPEMRICVNCGKGFYDTTYSIACHGCRNRSTVYVPGTTMHASVRLITEAEYKTLDKSKALLEELVRYCTHLFSDGMTYDCCIIGDGEIYEELVPERELAEFLIKKLLVREGYMSDESCQDATECA